MQKIKERLNYDLSKLPVNMFNIFFPIDEELIEFFLKLKSHSMLDSTLFGMFLSRDLPKSKKERHDLTLHQVYQKPIQSLRNFLKDLVINQEILIEELPSYFTTTTMVLDELVQCCSYLKDIKLTNDPKFDKKYLVSCANKITCVIKSNECSQFAVDALNVRDKLGLQGDFSQMKKLQSMSMVKKLF